MARPRKKTFTMLQYTENVNDGYISNNFKTQRFPKWKPIVDGLAVTILNDDYISPIILAENEDGQTQIVDGGSRTAAYMMIKYGNYKIKSSVEDPIIEYKSMSKDENVWWKNDSDICGVFMKGCGYGLTTFYNCYFERNHPLNSPIKPNNLSNMPSSKAPKKVETSYLRAR